MKNFEVLSLQWDKNDWDYASSVRACDHEQAAQKWAEERDQEGDYSIIGDGEHGPVWVRLESEEAFKIFNIFAESCPSYSASEVTK